MLIWSFVAEATPFERKLTYLKNANKKHEQYIFSTDLKFSIFVNTIIAPLHFVPFRTSFTPLSKPCCRTLRASPTFGLTSRRVSVNTSKNMKSECRQKKNGLSKMSFLMKNPKSSKNGPQGSWLSLERISDQNTGRISFSPLPVESRFAASSPILTKKAKFDELTASDKPIR